MEINMNLESSVVALDEMKTRLKKICDLVASIDPITGEGKPDVINNYANLLKEKLGLSREDSEKIKEQLSNIL